MTRLGRAAIMLWLGGFTIRLVLTGGFGWFVQQHMRYPLLAAAIVLVVFGFHEALRTADDEARDRSSAKRSVAPRVGWLLILPFIVLVSVAPTGLGAAAASRVDAFTPTESTREFSALEASSGPVEMRVLEFLDRAIWDEARSLDGRQVRLEGLVVNDPSVPDGFKLTRFMVSCCAADGIPLQVAVHGAEGLEDDTWVIADVVWRPPDTPYDEIEGDWAVEADAIGITAVPDPPSDPYESPY